MIRSSGSAKARLAVVVRRRTDEMPATGLRSVACVWGAPMSLVKGNGGALGRGAGQHGGVADLLWDDVSSWSLPDMRVPDASVQDWQTVLDLVAEEGWKCHYS